METWDKEELEFWRNKYRDQPNFRFHLYADNLEFAYPAVVERLRKMCVDVHHTAPYHSSSNGLAERGIGVLDQKERTLRIARNMPECFREDAWNFSIFLTNIFPFRYEGNWHTDPHTQYKGKTFDYSKLRVPFSVCYVYNPQRIKGQDVRKGRKGIFCGYVPNSDAYKVWVLSLSDYVTTADVTWDEKELQPLIKQATINELRENSDMNHPNSNTDSASFQDREEPSHMGPVTGPHNPDLKASVPIKGGADISTSEECTVTDEFDWETWLSVAMVRLGHFLASGTR